MKDYYRILGVSDQASSTEIKKAYRRLAVMYHPDKNSSSQAENLFKEINEAYDVLSDVNKKWFYDQRRSNPLQEVLQEPTSHPDPRYRRKRPANYPRPNQSPTPRQLMKKYLPYFQWLNWPGLIIMFVIAFDFFLPVVISEEDVIRTYSVYTHSRRGTQTYSYSVLETSERKIKMRENGLHSLRDEQIIVVKHTPILSTVKEVINPDNNEMAYIGGIYNEVLMIPLFLCFTSLLGILLRKNIEYAFNFSIGNGILLIFVIYLMLVI